MEIEAVIVLLEFGLSKGKELYIHEKNLINFFNICQEILEYNNNIKLKKEILNINKFIINIEKYYIRDNVLTNEGFIFIKQILKLIIMINYPKKTKKLSSSINKNRLEYITNNKKINKYDILKLSNLNRCKDVANKLGISTHQFYKIRLKFDIDTWPPNTIVV